MICLENSRLILRPCTLIFGMSPLHRHQDPLLRVSSLDPSGLNSGRTIASISASHAQSKSASESAPESAPEPEPAYIHEPLPDDPQKLAELLQSELARRTPNRGFVRSVLRHSKYQLSKELRCRAYSILLDIDSSLVTSLADNTWSVNTVNSGIIEDYLHHIYPCFSENGTSS